MLVARVPPVGGLLLPVRRRQVAVEPDPVGDALDQAAGAGAEGVPLQAVDELVGDDAGDFLGGALLARAGDVVEREVDLLVVVVELGARCVGHARHVAEDEGDGAGGRRRGGGRGRGGVEEAEDVAGGGDDGFGGIDRGEGQVGAWVGEISDLEAELGQGEVFRLGAWWFLGGCGGSFSWE